MVTVKKYRFLMRAVFGFVVLLIFFVATNPSELALGFLVVPILLLSFVVYELTRYFFSLFAGDKHIRLQQIISLILAVSVGILVMLQSIGQLVAGDFAIVVFFAVISIFYASRFR